MILVLNRLQLLSGNKFYYGFLLIVFFGACSPKIIPPTQPKTQPSQEKPKPQEPETVKTEKADKEEKVVNKYATISLLLPFELDKINYRTAFSKDLAKADLAIDFYQGFKMALDSVANKKDINFKLQVYDSKDDPSKLSLVATKAGVKNSDLVVGPIFPSGIKAFSVYSKNLKQVQVSPLSPTDPSAFLNPYLVTINNSLDQHAQKAATFIKKTLKPKKIILIRSGQSDEYKYANPFKKQMDSLGKGVVFTELGIKAIGYENVFKYLTLTGMNVIVLPSTERIFLLTITKELEKLSDKYQIAIIGHPSWEKASFLNADMMQKLNSYITSSYKIDFKSNQVNSFIKNYRQIYQLEPGEYAFKGFDIGYYFGELLADNGKEFSSKINSSSYKGIHNNFFFVKNPKSGFYNSNLMMLKYENFELRKVN